MVWPDVVWISVSQLVGRALAERGSRVIRHGTFTLLSVSFICNRLIYDSKV